MKKILNSTADYVDEMLAGLVAAHPEYYRFHGDSGKVVARAKSGSAGKVGIVTGGGSGHLPVFTGYVGEGLLDACAIGDVLPHRRLNRWLMPFARLTKVRGCCACMEITEEMS